MKTFFRLLALITGWPAQLIFFKRKTYYESPAAKKTKRNGAIIITNHTALLFDYMMNLFIFPFKKLYCLIGEVMYNKGGLLRFIIDCMGGIKVNRDTKDLSFIDTSVELLLRGKLLQIFPEGHIEKDKKLDAFKSAYVYIALKSGKPIVPVVTDGNYGLTKRAHVMIGDEIYLSDYYKGDNPTKEDIERLNDIVYTKFKKLQRRLEASVIRDRSKVTFFDKILWDLGKIFTYGFNIGLRVKVHGENKRQKLYKKGAFIIASNHVGMYDPVVIICAFWHRRIKSLTADVVFEGKKVREFMMTKLGCIKINRNIDDVDAFKKCVAALNDGYPLLIFPEGHIVVDGKTESYKSGAALMATLTGAPILPVYIKKRTKWYRRTHLYLGDFIDVERGAKRPEELETYNQMMAESIRALEREAEKDEERRNIRHA